MMDGSPTLLVSRGSGVLLYNLQEGVLDHKGLSMIEYRLATTIVAKAENIFGMSFSNMFGKKPVAPQQSGGGGGGGQEAAAAVTYKVGGDEDDEDTGSVVVCLVAFLVAGHSSALSFVEARVWA